MTMRRLIALCLFVAPLTGGCSVLSGPGGELEIRSAQLDNATVIAGEFDTAVYAAEDAQTLHALLIDGPIDNPVKALHVRMFWEPRAGKTPFDPSATNATVRLVVFEGESIGIYGGGGLLRMHSKPGSNSFRASLRNASLRLLDANESFTDTLTVAVAEGGFTAQRDDQRTLELLRKLNILVEERLGYPRFVDAGR